VLSLRARAMRRAFAVTIRLLRARRGGLPSPDAPVEELESYALQARAQLEDLAQHVRAPRAASVSSPADAPVRSLVVADGETTVPHNGLPASTDRVVLYLHGGAYCLGSPELYRGLAGALARTAGATVVLPDYRLAPEHPYPAALDDVVEAWDWLTRSRGIDATRIAVAGDSSGAGLAAALCLRLRDEQRPTPACLAAISPWTDLAATGGSLIDNEASDVWIPPRLIGPVARAYAGDRPLDDPLVSPLYGDLRGLPPTLVHVGTDEVLLDDATRFVTKARAHGVDASLGRFEGLWHVFHAFPGFPESRAAVQELGAFVRRHTTPPERGLAA
jgi:epsilon-lactone hydrolase